MNKNELSNNLLDQILKYIVEKKVEELPESLPSKAELDGIKFRPEFKKKMDNLFKAAYKKNKTRRIALRVGIATIAFFCIFSTFIFSVDALRIPFLNFFSEMNEESITIHVDDEIAKYDAFADQIKGLYLPSYIPEAYSVVSVDILDDYYRVLYSDNNQNEIEIRKVFAGYSIGIDDEGANIESLTINEEPAQYFKKNNMSTLIYQYDRKAFMLYGNISKDEMVRMAESMRHRN